MNCDYTNCQMQDFAIDLEREDGSWHIECLDEYNSHEAAYWAAISAAGLLDAPEQDMSDSYEAGDPKAFALENI